MRRVLAVLMTTICLLLCGCAGEESAVSPAIAFRAELVQAGGCTFCAEVTADFGTTVEQFSLEAQANADGTAALEVLAPETIAGITATTSEGGGSITFDGMAVDFGLLANGNVIPLAAPSIAAACWMREYICAAGEEDGLYRVTYERDYDEKRLIVDTWFENGLPICAEVCYNNQRFLKILITEFSMN